MREIPRFLDQPATEAPPPAAAAAVPPPPVHSTPMLLDARLNAPDAAGADWNPRELAERRGGFGSAFYAAAGLTIILGSWVLLSALSSAFGLFSQSAGLGGLALALYAGGAGMLLYAGGREFASLRRLHQVDRLRAALNGAGGDLAAERAVCSAWLDRLAPFVPEAALVAASLPGITDLAQLRATLRNQLRAPLAAAAKRLGIKAASEVSALVALSPHPSWDGLIVAWRGLRLMRQVAQLHGLRPGPAVSIALLGRVGRAAVETAAADVVSQAAADHVLTNVPLIRHLRAIPAVSTAAFRLYRLAGVAARACSPLGE